MCVGWWWLWLGGRKNTVEKTKSEILNIPTFLGHSNLPEPENFAAAAAAAVDS